MITTLLAMMLTPGPSAAQTTTQLDPPADAVTVPSEVRKEHLVHDGRALLARAEQADRHYAPAKGRPSQKELRASIDQLRADLDSMSEMGEMESLRLQMAMDRVSKLMSTLSNLLKKISDTQKDITQNLK